MVKIQIKSEKLTSFDGIFPIMEKFDRMLSRTIDSTLGLRSKVYGYQYSEIIRSLMCVYFCGGSCVEDVTSHHMETLCLHPHLRTCSADTILRAIRELTTPNLTYKKFTGYSPGIATVGDGNTNVRFHQEDTLKRIFERLENAGIHINRARMDCGSCSEAIVEMVEKHCRHFYIRANKCASLYDDIFALRGWKTEYINGHEFEICSIIAEKWAGKAYRLVIQRQRSINKELDLWEGEYTYRCILTNDYTSTDRDIVEYYNKRGGAERILDDMNNGFGWNRLPKSFMAENTVFLLLTALIRNFYRHLISDANMKSFGLKCTSRIKTFVFKYVSVPAKWVKTARQHILNIYTSNDAYMMAFKFDFG